MIYNLFVVLSLPFIIPFFLLIAAVKPRYWVGLTERLGFWRVPSEDLKPRTEKNPRIWVHAASVGEVEAVWPLVEELAGRFASCHLILTSLTVTGRMLWKQRLADWKKESVTATVRLFPIDLPGLASWLLKKIQPDMILVVETEFWPNALSAAHRKAIPVVIVNGRVSPRAFSRYRLIRWILCPVLKNIDRYLMQTPHDADRIKRLGAPPYRVSIVGNLKFDQRVDILTDIEKEAHRAQWGWNQSDLVWVAGSTHPGEEESVLSVFLLIKKKYPSLRLILAPRHLERLPGVIDLVSRRQASFKLLNERETNRTTKHEGTKTGSTVDIILVNTIGQLRKLYSLGDVLFVGGSLTAVGGHNLIEAALLGKPVLYGPHIQHVQAVADLLEQSGGGIKVSNSEVLKQKLEWLLGETGIRLSMGEKARRAVHPYQGVVKRTADVVMELHARTRIKIISGLDQRNWVHRWVEDDLWQSRHQKTMILPGLALNGAATLYGAVQRAREAGYRKKVFNSIRLTRPVISVGNITVGGTGKTPTVIAICRSLLKAGLRPAVLSRGYGGNRRKTVLEVSDGQQIKWPATVVGDEPVLLAQKLTGVPVFVGSDRVQTGQAAITTHHPDVLVLDDGFQHRQLIRDLDVVLIHGPDPFGNGRLLPGGPLREPISHLKRADIFLLTHVISSEAVLGLVSFLRDTCPDQPCWLSRHQPVGYIPLFDGQNKPTRNAEFFSARQVFIVAGIARPDSFIQSVTQSGLDIVGYWVVPDHHLYETHEISIIQKEAKQCGAEAILTTEKDAIRLKLLKLPLDQWWAMEVGLSVYDNQGWEEMIMKAL